MRTRWALLTMVMALALGAGATTLAMQSMQVPLRLSLSCLLLQEAEKAGYLKQEGRNALIGKLAVAPSLAAADRQLVPLLASTCAELHL